MVDPPAHPTISAPIRADGNRRDLYAGLAILALAFGVRLAYLLQIRTNPFFLRPIIDAKMYDEHALAIAGGNLVGSEVFYQAPFYAYFLGLIYWIFGHDYFLARLFQITVGAFNCVLIYAIGRKVFRASVGFIAGLIAALYSTFIFFDAELLRTFLIIFLSLAALLVLLRAGDRPSTLRWAGAGLLLGLAAITWEAILLFVPCALFWMYLTLRDRKRLPEIVWCCALLCLAIGVVIFPVSLRNYRVTGDVVLISSQGGLNFYIGNNPEADRTTTIQPGEEWDDLVNLPASAAGITRPALRSRWFYTQALKYIRESPLGWLRLLGKKLLLFWQAAELDPNNDILFYRTCSRLFGVLYQPSWWIIIPFGVVGPLALVGMLLLPTKEANVRLLLLFMLSSMFALVLYHVRARYRLPVVPVLIIFAAWAVQRFWEGFKGGWRRREKAVFVSALLAATALVNVDFFSSRNAASFPLHTTLGKISLERGSLDQARAEFLKAVEDNPGDYDALVNLGVIQVRQGEMAEALDSFRRAIRAKPDYSIAHNDIGVWYYSQGLVDQAVTYLQRAVALRPSYTEAHYNLGIAYLKSGMFSQAELQFRRVIRLQPQHWGGHYELGLTYVAQKNYVRAAEEFRSTLKLNPRHGDARRYYELVQNAPRNQ